MKFFKSEIIDERIIGLKKKYGFEALYIASGLAFIDFIIKVIILKRGFIENMDLYYITLIPWVYYAIRGSFGGVYLERKQALRKRIYGGLLGAILIIVSIIGVLNDKISNKISDVISFSKGVFSGVIVGILFFAVISYVSKKINKAEIND